MECVSRETYEAKSQINVSRETLLAIMLAAVVFHVKHIALLLPVVSRETIFDRYRPDACFT